MGLHLRLLLCCIFFTLHISVIFSGKISTEYQKNIVFTGENTFGTKFDIDLGGTGSEILENCPVNGNFTVLTHGWRASYHMFWVRDMIERFKSFRRGCIVFMDYHFYSKLDYPILAEIHFKGVSGVLTNLLQLFEKLGFRPQNGWLFGSSFGTHVVFEGAYQYGPRKIGRVDACDPAQWCFNASSPSVIHARDSAMMVQCIHTSQNIGTPLRYCTFDMNMGNCGNSQAGGGTPLADHGLCQIFYNHSLVFDFKAYQKPVHCMASKDVPNVSKIKSPVFMGIRLNTSLPFGEYFIPTLARYPYSVEFNI